MQFMELFECKWSLPFSSRLEDIVLQRVKQMYGPLKPNFEVIRTSAILQQKELLFGKHMDWEKN